MNVEELQWLPTSANSASHTTGWRRGVCVEKLVTQSDKLTWLAAMFKDEEGYWFRGSARETEGKLPVFHGPFDTADEAKTAVLMVLRMGGEL